jgi:hypothetical protein
VLNFQLDQHFIHDVVGCKHFTVERILDFDFQAGRNQFKELVKLFLLFLQRYSFLKVLSHFYLLLIPKFNSKHDFVSLIQVLLSLRGGLISGCYQTCDVSEQNGL